MRVLVVFRHPRRASYCGTILDRFVAGLAEDYGPMRSHADTAELVGANVFSGAASLSWPPTVTLLDGEPRAARPGPRSRQGRTVQGTSP